MELVVIFLLVFHGVGFFGALLREDYLAIFRLIGDEDDVPFGEVERSDYVVLADIDGRP